MKVRVPVLPIGDCIQAQKHVRRVECGLVIASYLLSHPTELRKVDQGRIMDGLKTAQGLLTSIAPTALEEMKPAMKRARMAVTKALNVARNTPMPSNTNSRLKLSKLVAKALDANVAMEIVANRLCQNGRE